MASADNPRVTVVMALYHPDLPRLERQVATIRDQADVEIDLCFFSDGPIPQASEVEALAAKHSNVSFEQFPTNRGPAATFISAMEAALQLHPGNEFLAFADQDDVWHRDKLARSLEALVREDAAAVHSDARLVNGDGAEIAASMFDYEHRDRRPSLKRLFFRNNATGMTMAMTRTHARRVVEMEGLRPDAWLHDHFTALLAKAGEGLALLDRPSVDYVQHGGNVVGAQPVRRTVRSGGSFLRAGSRSDEILRQGTALVEALLRSDWVSPAGKSELASLEAMLKGRGIGNLVASIGELAGLTRNARPLFARLAWCKLTSHQWRQGEGAK